MNGLSNAVWVNVAGLGLAAGGMLLQVAAGSKLYPSLTGPVVLLGAAALVVFRPGRWAAYVGLLVPLVLGVGAIVAAAMTGEFVSQLTDVGRPGIVIGSLAHVIGLIAGAAGAVGMFQAQRKGVV